MKLSAGVLGIAVIIVWGLWGFLYKIGISKMGMHKALFWSSLAYTIINIIIILVLLRSGVKPEFNSGVNAILLGSVFAALGTLIFLFSLEKYQASIVIPLTALYPIVSVLLGILLLKESLTAQHFAGIVLGVIAGYLLAT